MQFQSKQPRALRPKYPTLRMVALSCVLSASVQAATLTVNTATDDFGAVSGNCSLREAIHSANVNANFGGCIGSGAYGTDTINLPTLASGAFQLTRSSAGDEDNTATGDLDIRGNLTIQGVSASNSAIRANQSVPNSERDRVIHIISGTVTLNDLTLRDGYVLNGRAGGGLRSEPGSTTRLNRVVVGFNRADGNAGGVLNRGSMTIRNSTIFENQSDVAPGVDLGVGGGGGIFNSANATIAVFDTRVINNRLSPGRDTFETSAGGGLHNLGDALIDNCLISDNTANGAFWLNGLGIYSAGPIQLLQSTISNNRIRDLGASGGGVYLGHPDAMISRSLIVSNQAGDGAGVYLASGRILDSVLRNNTALRLGGGAFVHFQTSASALIQRSTLNANEAEAGGGIFAQGSVAIENTSILTNHATKTGGGLHANAYLGGINEVNPTITLSSVSIVGNRSNSDNLNGGNGGGIYEQDALVQMRNSVIAGNLAEGLADGDDCYGDLLSLGHSLVQQAQNACNHFVHPTDLLGVNANLAALSNVDGPIVGSTFEALELMSVRAPLVGSALVDRADATGCRSGAQNQLLQTDQLGRNRSLDGPDADTQARCDIGAIEFVSATP